MVPAVQRLRIATPDRGVGRSSPRLSPVLLGAGEELRVPGIPGVLLRGRVYDRGREQRRGHIFLRDARVRPVPGRHVCCLLVAARPEESARPDVARIRRVPSVGVQHAGGAAADAAGTNPKRHLHHIRSTMRRRNLALCCCTLLFIASSSEPLENSTTTTSDNERNNFTVRYQIHTNVTTTNRSGDAETMRYNARENSTRSNDGVQYELRLNSTSIHEDDDSVRYEFHAHSTKDHGGGDQTSMELRMNSTDDKINSTAHEPSGNLMQDLIEDRSNLTLYQHLGKFSQDDNKRNVVPYEMCENSICIPLCCPLGVRMIMDQCVVENVGRYSFPGVYEQATNESFERGPIGEVDQIFQLTVHDPCPKVGRYVLDPDEEPNDAFMFLLNGSLYRPRIKEVDIDLYCLIVFQRDKYEIAVCFDPSDSSEPVPDGYHVGLIISLPFLLTTFVVYSILPELQNMHGYTLRGYVGSLFVAYTSLAVIQQIPQTSLSDAACIILAFIIHFSFLASFFWLNVMCFDIWWTFGGFRSLQGSVKQRERKKFVMYSIYAWGSASILTVICVIMDFVPSVPKELIRPEIGVTKCWFNTNEARALYFYLPMSVTVVCNICLFISTALKIVRHKKDTAAHLRSSESRRHDDNKQWFNLYLKLFIVMGINWSMEIISWVFEQNSPAYIWYLTDLTNTLQGLIIFIIFVWKEKIKRLLLKRFGCQDRGLFSRNSTRSGCHSSASRTCTTTSGMMSLQEKVNPYVQTNCRMKSSSDEAD
ncbi:G-protein coupled receptor Mth2-like isoform X3 [Temnothorax longispinosus]